MSDQIESIADAISLIVMAMSDQLKPRKKQKLLAALREALDVAQERTFLPDGKTGVVPGPGISPAAELILKRTIDLLDVERTSRL